jgi:hypothetical protein
MAFYKYCFIDTLICLYSVLINFMCYYDSIWAQTRAHGRTPFCRVVNSFVGWGTLQRVYHPTLMTGMRKEYKISKCDLDELPNLPLAGHEWRGQTLPASWLSQDTRVPRLSVYVFASMQASATVACRIMQGSIYLCGECASTCSHMVVSDFVFPLACIRVTMGKMTFLDNSWKFPICVLSFL